jgi:hypothetical protein
VTGCERAWARSWSATATGWATTSAGKEATFVVHDWDSAVVDTEAVLVGFAAALYSTVSSDDLPAVEDTDRFLEAYCDARGRAFSADEFERAWAAGVWTRACDAKDQHVMGHAIVCLSEAEARARLRRAAID